MFNSLDLNLPAQAPLESFQKESHNTDQIAVYTLVDLGQSGIQGLLKALTRNDDDMFKNVCRLPPKYNFEGATLKNVYGYHLKLAGERTHHPTLFIVAHHEDHEKNGVLLVNLNRDLKCTIDTCRIEASEVLSAAMNLMIANMDWEDFKKEELPLPAESAGANASGTAVPSNQADSQRQAQLLSAPPYIFGVYTTAGANMTEIRGLLEPGWSEKPPKTWLCETIGSYTKFPKPWDRLIKYHPWNCHRNKRMHRQWFICADEQDPKEKGVILVHMDWDGNIERDPNKLLEIGPNVDVTTERSEVENAMARLLVIVSQE